MKQKIDYWLDTLSPSLLFIAGFFVIFFVYFSWTIGIYSVLFFLFALASYFVFFKELDSHEVLKLDEAVYGQYEEYKNLFSLSQEGMILLVEDELHDANSNFEELVGKSIHSIRSREWLKLIHEEDILPFIDWVHLSDQNLDQSFLLRIFNHANGELLWLKARKLYVPTLSAKKMFIISFKVVSDQKVYQEKALESQIQVYTLIDFAPMGVVIFDNEGKPEYINKFGQTLIGYNRIELLQLGFSKLVIEEKHTAFLSQWDNYLKGDTDSFVASTTILSKSGYPLEVILNCVAVKNLEGKINSYFLTIVDLTETQKLASKNQFFVGLLNNSDAISIVDTSGIIVEANKLFEDKIGNNKADIVGRNYNKLFLGKNGLPEALATLKKEDVYRDEIFHQSSDKNVWLDRTFIPYFSGEILEHFYVIHRDITQRVTQELEIKRNNNVLKFLTTAQNDFISSSHDKTSFRNILEKISNLKETALSCIVDIEEREGTNFSILSHYKNSLYVGDDEEISEHEILSILKSENLFGNSVLFESSLLVNSLDSDFGPFEENLGVKRIRNLISFPILRNQKVIGLLILINSKQKPAQGDLKNFEPVTTSLATMVFAYKEVQFRNLVESQNLKLQEKVTNQLQQLDQILKSSPDTYIMFDAFGNLEFISRKSMKFLGAERLFQVGASIYQLTKENYPYASLFIELFEKALNGHYANLNFSDPTESKDYQMEFINIKNSAAEITSILCVIKDITEQKLFERELSVARDSALTASESKSEYLASLHKELESPLSTLLNLIRMFEEKNLDKEKNEFIGLFKKAANEINHHVERFFNLTVSPMETLQMNSHEVDIGKTFKDILNDYQKIFHKNQLICQLGDCRETTIVLKTSQDDLTKVFKSIFDFLTEQVTNAKIDFCFTTINDGGTTVRLNLKMKNVVISLPYLKYLRSNDIGNDFKLTLKTLNLKKELVTFNVGFSFLSEVDSLELDFYFNENQALYSINSLLQEDSDTVDVATTNVSEVSELITPVALEMSSPLIASETKESAIIFDHRLDYISTLESFLSEKEVIAMRSASLDECLEKIKERNYDYLFVDLSHNLPDMEGIIKCLEQSSVKKVVASLPLNMQTTVKNGALDSKICFIPRPFKKADLKQFIQ